MDVLVIIPARDEADSVAQVVARTRRAMPGARLVVVDNGSSDATAERAAAAGAAIVSCARPGYGYAVRAGIDGSRPADIYAFLDADGSMAPEDLTTLVSPIIAGDADIVVGRRAVSRRLMPWHQRVGNRVISIMLRRHGVRVAELGPFRAVRGSTLASMRLPGSRYGWPAEMLARGARNGARILEVRVAYAARTTGRSKVGGSVRGSVLATWDISRALLGRRVG